MKRHSCNDGAAMNVYRGDHIMVFEGFVLVRLGRERASLLLAVVDLALTRRIQQFAK